VGAPAIRNQIAIMSRTKRFRLHLREGLMPGAASFLSIAPEYTDAPRLSAIDGGTPGIAAPQARHAGVGSLRAAVPDTVREDA
jgi:hypothetical protein